MPTDLKRELGLWAALSIVVGTVIGSGIFRVPQTMIQSVGSIRLVFLAWIVGGAMSLAGALTYGELAAALPGAGGEYVYLTEAYGPFWGYLYSWTQFSVAKSGSIASFATAFFEYTAHFVPQFEQTWFVAGPFTVKYGQGFGVVLILALGFVNYFGVKFGGNIQIVLTGAKIGLIAWIILAGLLYRHPVLAGSRFRLGRPDPRASLAFPDLPPLWWLPYGLTTDGTTLAWWRAR